MSDAVLEARAQRLLRWYPRRWREHYGDEFAELLVAELEESDRSWRRTVDVARNGLVARMSGFGLAGGPVRSAQASVLAATVGGVAFVTCGLSLWSQLLTGWRWSSLDTHDVRFGVLAMSIAGVGLAALAILAAAPLAVAVARELRGRDRMRVLLPLAVTIAGVTFLVFGGVHLQAAWPGATGHPTHLRRLVPGGIVGFAWAETLMLTTYPVHPSALLALPHAQAAWILSSPLVLAVTVASGLVVARRVTLPASVRRYELRLAGTAAAAMALFLGAAGWWVIDSRTQSSVIFRAGSLDLLMVTAMAAALTVATAATRQMRRD